jgi:predicted Zn finger-like uncharacterized protein
MLVLIRCPTCKGMAQVDNKHLGATVRCPRCKEPFTAVQAGPEPEGPGAAAADAKPEPLANGPTWTSAAGKSQPVIAFEQEEKMRPLSLERVPWARGDRFLPAKPLPFLLAVAGVSAGAWLAGLALAPIKWGFIEAHEWQVQPFFLATHFICLRLFVTCYTRNFLAGAARMDLPEGLAVRRVKQLLGPLGGLLALLIAIPLCIKDFTYLGEEDYIGTIADGVRTGALAYGGTGYSPVDIFTWLVWCVEWFLNAYIWVILVGFLGLTLWALLKHRFRATIEVLLHEKHYRPFLMMSAQGASIVLIFGLVNAFYVWYAEGNLDDYIGLAIDGGLLLLGFGPPWMLLKSNVERAVNQEMFRLQERLVEAMQRRAEAEANGPVAITPEHLAERLDNALAVLRTMYLERMHKELGRAEGKALLLKLLGPASTIGWKMVRPLVLPG